VTFTEPVGWVVGCEAGGVASCATAVAVCNTKAIAVTATAGTSHRNRLLMIEPPKKPMLSNKTDALPFARGDGLAF
jgi:hypothetical protein